MMEQPEKQRLVDQEAANAQTVQFVADRATEMASQADNLAKKDPSWSAVAAVEREHRKTLMELAREERQLATAIQLNVQPADVLAAQEREHRKELLETARAEGQLAGELRQRLAQLPDQEGEDGAAIGVIAEQAERNQELLRHVAKTVDTAAQALRDKDSPATSRDS